MGILVVATTGGLRKMNGTHDFPETVGNVIPTDEVILFRGSRRGWDGRYTGGTSISVFLFMNMNLLRERSHFKALNSE